MGKPLVELLGVSVSFLERRASVLKSVNFKIDEGEWVSVIGPGGAGKSTLARVCVGLVRPTGGRVERKTQVKVGWVTQNPSDALVGSTVGEDVALGLASPGLTQDEVKGRVGEALKAVGLAEEVAHRDPWTLSGGEQQRAVIAGAMLEADLLVLDEPTSMLDKAAGEKVLSCVERLRQDGKSVLFVTHELAEAARADRVVALDNGCLVADGPPGDVLSSVSVLARLGSAAPPLIELQVALKQRGVELNPKGWSVEAWYKAILQEWGGFK